MPLPVIAAKFAAYLVKMGISTVVAKAAAKKIAGVATKAYKSKHFWPGVVGAGFVGQTGLTELGRAGERKLTKEQMELQNLLGASSAEATKKLTEESKAKTKEYVKALLAAKRDERDKELDRTMMESFMSSQDRQMAMAMQAIQTQNAPRTGGMTNVLRSAF